MFINAETEKDDAPSARQRPIDLISLAAGSRVYVRPLRIGLCRRTPMGNGPRLRVSRFYLDAKPPVAVDFRSELTMGSAEIEAKRAYFEKRGVRYVVAENEWDEEAEARLRGVPTLTEMANSTEVIPPPDSAKPQTSARRRRRR